MAKKKPKKESSKKKRTRVPRTKIERLAMLTPCRYLDVSTAGHNEAQRREMRRASDAMPVAGRFNARERGRNQRYEL